MRPLEELYEQGRDRVVQLVAEADPTALGTAVPACPAWSVHDVLAHLAGLCTDVVSGNIAGAATDAWTDAQVTARCGASLADLLGEWAVVGPQVAAMLDDFPAPYGEQVVTDLAVHEHDIRGAFDRPGARQSEAVAAGLEFLVSTFVQPEATERGLDPLAVTTLDVAPFELFRALTGRRSAEQVRRYEWSLDPAPYLPLFALGPFTLRPTELVE